MTDPKVHSHDNTAYNKLFSHSTTNEWIDNNHMATPTPKALFDTLEHIDEMPSCVAHTLKQLDLPDAQHQFDLAREFLLSYAGSADTFNAYRKEVERFVQWAWLIAEKPLSAIDRSDIRRYVEFAQHPPTNWVGVKSVARFTWKNGERSHNKDWRPFVARISKAQRLAGATPDKDDFTLSNSALEGLFAGLSTFFTYLQQEQYVEVNPVQLVRQKSRFIQKRQSSRVTRKLSQTQWQFMLESIQQRADTDSYYERHLFLIAAFYLLGLRISELSETPGRIPCMGDFAPDKHDRWWFTTVGKGNKLREVAVPDAMLAMLKRYRLSRGLTPLPARGEATPLIHKDRGRNGLGTRQIRNIIQDCFTTAVHTLRQAGKSDEADDLAAATVHWLRHTAISADVEHRPREHVRDDAGHENASITDRYIDTDRAERHASAKHKPLMPKTAMVKEPSKED